MFVIFAATVSRYTCKFNIVVLQLEPLLDELLEMGPANLASQPIVEPEQAVGGTTHLVTRNKTSYDKRVQSGSRFFNRPFRRAGM